jgi:hypothetical protein
VKKRLLKLSELRKPEKVMNQIPEDVSAEQLFQILNKKAEEDGMSHKLAMLIVDCYKLIPNQKVNQLAQAVLAIAWMLKHVEELVK